MAKIMPVHPAKHIEPAPTPAAAEKQHALPSEEGSVSATAAPAAIDPYLARSVKSSPNGF